MGYVVRKALGVKPIILASAAATLAVTAAGFSPALADYAAAAAPNGSTLYVSPHGSDTANSCTKASQPCLTIAHAVAEAPSGATIKVLPGTYVNSATVGIDLFQPVTLRAIGNVILTGTGPIFDLYNFANPSAGVTGVTIMGFHFQNVTGSGYNGVITTPGYGAGDVNITRNTFTNITDEAVGYHGNSGLTAPLGTGWRIVGNTVSGVTHPSRSGFWLGGLSDSVIADNEVSNTGHAGIILTANGPTSQSNSNNQVLRNRIANIPYEGIQVAFGNNILVEGNAIANAGTAGTLPPNPSVSSTAAIMLFNASQTNITVVQNTATGSYDGLTVGQPPYSGTAPLGTGIVVIENNFTNETNAGIADYAPTGSAPLNAMLNWWGCKTGPNTPGCSTTQGSVDYAPWLMHPTHVFAYGLPG